MDADKYLELYRKAQIRRFEVLKAAREAEDLAMRLYFQADELNVRGEILFALHYRALKGLPTDGSDIHP